MRSDFQNVDKSGKQRHIVQTCSCFGYSWVCLLAVSFALFDAADTIAESVGTESVGTAGSDSVDASAEPPQDEPGVDRLGVDDERDPSADRGSAAQLPKALRDWQDWAVWDDTLRTSPAVYSNSGDRIPFWPSKLTLIVDAREGRWELAVATFSDAWVPLPGSDKVWPTDVRSNGTAIAVLSRDGLPRVQLAAGTYRITGSFSWHEMPQRLRVPAEIGIIDLHVNREHVPTPTWSTDGQLWLRRGQAVPAEKDLLSIQVYRLLEDGIPMWLETEIELTVSGKSREEELGWLLPDAFLLSTVDSPIPVAIDREGRIRAQVRAGKWTIRTRSFRTQHSDMIGYAPQVTPMLDTELVGFASNPAFRVAEVDGLETVDVTQTTFPENWRSFPVYRWNTDAEFRLIQKIRGMGEKHLGGLHIKRRLWLDDDGAAFTYEDNLSGGSQQIWRLDVAAGHELGAVRSGGEGQLITKNPQTEGVGIEVRSRTVDLQAVGRVPNQARLPATGWLSDADSLEATLILPPGWRAFACFGADRVQGDWLTAWTLLDMFLLLVLTLALFRTWGPVAGLVAFLAFGLTYHEYGSPRLTWFFLLVPVALARVVPDGGLKRFVHLWRAVAVVVLLLFLVPFLVTQIQSAIYPQLERNGIQYQPRTVWWAFAPVSVPREAARRVAGAAVTLDTADPFAGADSSANQKFRGLRAAKRTSNMMYDPQVKIQTGPAQPDWMWNRVTCSWDGPVSEDERLRPLLIPCNLHRLLNVARVLLLLGLTGILIRSDRWRLPWVGGRTPVTATLIALLMVMAVVPPTVAAEIPTDSMLELLRSRLTKPSDAFPRAAEIAEANLTIDGNRVDMQVEVHTAEQVAVPLPGKLSDASPVSVLVDGEPASLVCRKDGFLWSVLPKGVHHVEVKSLLPAVSEWEWAYQLAPHRVTVEAPGWTVYGIDESGHPQSEVSFVRNRQEPAGQAAYDRNDFHVPLVVDRFVEIGLTWQVRSVVTRLSEGGKAVSLQIPLLPNEKVLSGGARVTNDQIHIRLGSGERTANWTGELTVGPQIRLATRSDDEWVERWHLTASPVWNVQQIGLAPVFSSDTSGLVPVWYPWPGESTILALHRPSAVSGDVLTVQRVQETQVLGRRQRTTEIEVQVESSLGTDFPLVIPDDANVTSLMVGDRLLPVRREDGKVVIPIGRGKELVHVSWQRPESIRWLASVDAVTLPVEAANVTTVMHVPESRWVLWSDGPREGPAVRFWVIVVTAVIIGLVLGSISVSPLRRWEWILLAIGLTQVFIPAALIVVGWLFLLVYRGQTSRMDRPAWRFNLLQLAIVGVTFLALVTLVVIVRQGLLGNPEMFILGNGSRRTLLRWFQPRTDATLPVASIVSVPVMYYRVLMLGWALWLAASLVRWLRWGWSQWSDGQIWKRFRKSAAAG